MIKSKLSTLFLSILLLVATAGGAQARSPVDSASKSTISRSDNRARCQNVSSKLDRQHQRLTKINLAIGQLVHSSQDGAVQSTALKALGCILRATALLQMYKPGAMEQYVTEIADALYREGIDKNVAIDFLIVDTEQNTDLIDEQLQQAENYLKEAQAAAGH